MCTHLYSVLLTPQQAAVNPYLRWRLLDIHRQVWLHLMWGTTPFSWLLVYTRFCLYPPQVCFPSPVEVL